MEIEQDIGSDLNLKLESDRLKTFQLRNWPAVVPIGYEKLAKAGFYYEGHRDEVRCFACNVTASKWSFESQAIAVHRTISPECPFLRTPNDTGNVPIVNFGTTQLSPLPAPGTVTQDSTRTEVPTEGSTISSNPDEDKDESTSEPRIPTVAFSNNRGPIVPNLSSKKQRSSMVNEQNRARTFTSSHWKNAEVSTSALVRWGFYYSGKGDTVICAFCSGCLNNWTRNDEPGREHLNHFPKCPFMLKHRHLIGQQIDAPSTSTDTQGKSSTGAAQSPRNPDTKQSTSDDSSWVVVSPLNDHIGTMVLDSENGETLDTLDTLGIFVRPPDASNLSTLQARLETFQEWPLHSLLEPKQLGAAGFYYTGRGDAVKCFQCGGGLRNWLRQDEPWTEHARWFPKCQFLRSSKGDNFIRSIQDKHNKPIITGNICGSAGDTPSQSGSQSAAQPEHHPELFIDSPAEDVDTPVTFSDLVLNGVNIQSKTIRAALEMGYSEMAITTAVAENEFSEFDDIGSLVDAIDAIRTRDPDFNAKDNEISAQVKDPEILEAENRLLKEQKLCKICMDSDASIVFLPCGHLVSCPACAPAMKDCPICRVQVRGTVRAYIT